MDYSSDGTVLASGGGDCQVKLWDMKKVREEWEAGARDKDAMDVDEQEVVQRYEIITLCVHCQPLP